MSWNGAKQLFPFVCPVLLVRTQMKACIVFKRVQLLQFSDQRRVFFFSNLEPKHSVSQETDAFIF